MRTTYGEIHDRAKRLSNALLGLGVKPGDRVATLALEHRPPYRGLVRDHGDRRGLPHAEPAPVRRAALLHHQPRRRSDHLHRPDLPADADGSTAPHAHRRAVHRHDRRGPHARRSACEGALCYETPDRGARRRLRLGRVRRADRLRPLLHLRHHRQPEGRALFAPLELPAHPDHAAGRRDGPSARDTVLAVVPMFHANAWGLAFSCPAVGAKLVHAGRARWTAPRSTS